MQATVRRLSDVYSKSTPRRRLIRGVGSTTTPPMLSPEIQLLLDAAKGHLTQAISRFAMASVIDRHSFEALRTTLPRLVEACRSAWLLPKDFLSSLRSAQWQLSNGAAHSDDPAFVREQALLLERAFDSLLAGESMDDRRPGVPRII